MFLRARSFGRFTRRASSKISIGRCCPKHPIHYIGMGVTHFYFEEDEHSNKPTSDYDVHSLSEVNGIKELDRHYPLEYHDGIHIRADVEFFYRGNSPNGLVWLLSKFKGESSQFKEGFNRMMELHINEFDNNTLVTQVSSALPKADVTKLFFEFLQDGPKDNFEKLIEFRSIIFALNLKVYQSFDRLMSEDALMNLQILKHMVYFFESTGEHFDIHRHNGWLLRRAYELQKHDIIDYLIDISHRNGYARFDPHILEYIPNLWMRDLEKLAALRRRL